MGRRHPGTVDGAQRHRHHLAVLRAEPSIAGRPPSPTGAQCTNFPEVMFSAAGAVARWIAPFLTVAVVAGTGFLADPVHVGPAPAVRLTDAANPLAGMPFYVN